MARRADDPGEIIRMQARLANAGLAFEKPQASRIRTLVAQLAALAVAPDSLSRLCLASPAPSRADGLTPGTSSSPATSNG